MIHFAVTSAQPKKNRLADTAAFVDLFDHVSTTFFRVLQNNQRKPFSILTIVEQPAASNNKSFAQSFVLGAF